MVTTPDDKPVTTPDKLTVAVDGALLLHAPPGVASVRVIEDPAHTEDGPDIGPGAGVTVIPKETKQPPIE